MSMVDELIAGILRGPGCFRDSLRKVLEEDLQMSIHEFCSRTGISQSTIYKIMQEEREPNLRTVRNIIHAVRRLENHPGGNFIAVIASSQQHRRENGEGRWPRCEGEGVPRNHHRGSHHSCC
jgi:predicted transcriptional regulator